MLKPCKTCLVTQCKGLSLVCLHLGKLSGMNCDSVRRVHVRRGAVLQALLCGLHIASYAYAQCCVQTESWTPVHALYHSISPSLSLSQYQINPMICRVREIAAQGLSAEICLGLQCLHDCGSAWSSACTAAAQELAHAPVPLSEPPTSSAPVPLTVPGAVLLRHLHLSLRRERLLFIQLRLGLCPCWCQLLFKCLFQ